MNKITKYFLLLAWLFSSLTALAQSDSIATIHKVRFGENLYRISLKYGIEVSELRQLNKLQTNSIKTGQELIVGYKTKQQEVSKANPTRVTNYLQRLESMVENVEALYFESMARHPHVDNSKAIEDASNIFKGNYSEASKYDLMKQLNESRISALKADVGLGFYSAVTHNFRPGVFDGEDLFFRNRASIGLDWRLLGSGLNGNKEAIRRLQIENELNELLQQKDSKAGDYVYTFNYIIYLFNQAQIDHLNRRLFLINNFLDLASDLYLVRAMPWERILDLKTKRASLENMLKNLANYNTGFDSAYVDLSFDKSINAEQLPVLEIMPASIFGGVTMDTLQVKTLELQGRKLEIDYKKNRDFQLRTYARYNVFDSEDATLRTFGSVGATFTAPLFKDKRNEELKQREMAVLESELQEDLTTVNNELMNHYYEYEYTLKQYIDFLGKKELSQEMLRKELAKDYLDDPNYTPLNTVTYLDELYAIDYELLDLKQKLYLKLLKIYSLLDAGDIDEISYPIQFDHFFDKMVGNRAVYSWSESLKNYEPEFLIKYAINNEFDRLFLSQGSIANELIIETVKQYQQEGAQVFKLVGNNKLASDPTPSVIEEMVETTILQGFDGIQLDIEPHTLADWEARKDEYLNNLMSVVENTRTSGSGYLKVSISIPVFYPEDFLERLSLVVDEIVLMAYERSSVESVVNAIKEEVRIAGEKVSLAFRTNDFNDRLELEDFMKDIINSTGISNIVIHDLNSLIRLDQKTILGK